GGTNMRVWHLSAVIVHSAVLAGCAAVVLAPGPGSGTCRAADQTRYQLDFGSGKVAPGFLPVLPESIYNQELGYGFEPGATISAVDRGGDDPLRGDFCTSDRPFSFSVALPEGNYRVTVTLGDRAGESTTTVKAELRRLMLERVRTAPGEFKTCTFTANIRTPR